MKLPRPPTLPVVSGRNSMNEPRARFYMKERPVSSQPLQTVTLFTIAYHPQSRCRRRTRAQYIVRTVLHAPLGVSFSNRTLSRDRAMTAACVAKTPLLTRLPGSLKLKRCRLEPDGTPYRQSPSGVTTI